jgi:hypothetical protein
MPSEIQNCEAFSRRVKARLLSEEEFIEKHGSGTLRKSARIGLKTREHYLHERATFEFGWGFECVPESRVTWGDAISEADNKRITEVGWLVDRYATIAAFPDDEIETKYIVAELSTGNVEGIGIIIRKTSAQFIPYGFCVFCIVSEFREGQFQEVTNPC